MESDSDSGMGSPVETGAVQLVRGEEQHGNEIRKVSFHQPVSRSDW